MWDSYCPLCGSALDTGLRCTNASCPPKEKIYTCGDIVIKLMTLNKDGIREGITIKQIMENDICLD